MGDESPSLQRWSAGQVLIVHLETSIQAATTSGQGTDGNVWWTGVEKAHQVFNSLIR